MQPNVEAGLGWMAWTWQTVLEIRRPGGGERRGVLGLVTTRGDRLFISLLAAGFIHLLWLAFFGPPLYIASALALVLAALVFRYV
jgi:predicted small integral membrane protein